MLLNVLYVDDDCVKSVTVGYDTRNLDMCQCCEVVPSSVSPPTLPSVQVPCKAVMVFFHYCVMSNYFWLFIEGLYLFTLLVETFFPERRYFYWYTIVGWGECLFQTIVY